MSWGNSEGTKGRCDAKCHNATTPHCACMCGGRYHGAGAELGDRIRQHGDDILEAARARAAAEGLELQAKDLGELLDTLARPRPARVRQASLFDDEVQS
jgi:hypothetical protein